MTLAQEFYNNRGWDVSVRGGEDIQLRGISAGSGRERVFAGTGGGKRGGGWHVCFTDRWSEVGRGFRGEEGGGGQSGGVADVVCRVESRRGFQRLGHGMLF